MFDIILSASERRLLADVTAIHATEQRESRVEYIATVYGMMPATTWASYQALSHLPE